MEEEGRKRGREEGRKGGREEEEREWEGDGRQGSKDFPKQKFSEARIS